MKLIVWLWTMARVRSAYHRLLFSKRLRFMDELRPKLDGRTVIAMPDAMMFVTPADYRRAIKSVSARA